MFYLPPTRLSTSGMNHICIYSQLQSITALWLVLISRPAPAEGRRLSWRMWFGEILRWFARPKTISHPSTNRARRRVTSLIRQRCNYRYATPPPPPTPIFHCIYNVSHILCLHYVDRFQSILFGT